MVEISWLILMVTQVVVGPKALMHPDVEEALPGATYNALTRRAGTLLHFLMPSVVLIHLFVSVLLRHLRNVFPVVSHAAGFL